ncbi:TerD family protein [Neobacillus vireti]|uniref:TerD family protein n=1 Tax=Neobacillus vireti TaxID=220686 RepID=UPI002FFFDF1C
MMINLTKGGNINLTKTAPNVTKFKIGLGWDINKYDGIDFDLDASAALLNTNGKLTGDTSFVFFNNPSDSAGSVVYSGDNRTGKGEGHDEVIIVDLSKVLNEVDFIRFAVTIYEADKRNQNFGQVSNAFIEVINDGTGEVVVRYDLSEDFSVETCVITGELYRHNGEWKFKAIGAGYGGGLETYVNGIQ